MKCLLLDSKSNWLANFNLPLSQACLCSQSQRNSKSADPRNSSVLETLFLSIVFYNHVTRRKMSTADFDFVESFLDQFLFIEWKGFAL